MLSADKARNISNTQAKAQAPRPMRNLMQYAQDVPDGRAADFPGAPSLVTVLRTSSA